MAQPSKAGAVILFLFGLPFFCVGLIFALAFLDFLPSTHRSGSPLAGVAFGLAFAFIGAGLMFGAILGYRKSKQDQATREANPNSPWLWRADWATGRALSQRRNSIYGWWIGTAIASMIIGPFATAVPKGLRNSDPTVLLPLGLCVVPLILLVGALRATIRRERYGKTYFEFSSVPFAPGKHFAGQIHLKLDTSAEHGIDLRIACVRTIVTGSGKQQSTNSITLWQDEKNVPQGALSGGPLGTAIPVDFGIPQDGYETNHDDYRDQLAWILYAKADVPGVDYSDSFEVPVFRSGTNGQPFTAPSGFTSEPAYGSFGGSSGAAAGTAPAFESDASEVPAPQNPRVVVGIAADGSTEFYFPPFRNPARTLVLLLVTAGWTALVFYLTRSSAPWFFAPAFGIFDLLLIYGCVQSVFGSTRIVVGNGKIASLRRIVGFGKRREFSFSDVQSVLATLSVGSSNGTNEYYSIQLHTKDGRKLSLVDAITSRQEARWIVSQIEKLAGLKTDTHVELQGPLGSNYSAPPQRAFAGGMSASTVQQQNKIGIAIGFAVFAMFTGFMFLNVYRNAAVRHPATRSHNAGVSAARQRLRSSLPPLTDAESDRLQQLPMQTQAEELLERSIGHDPRALELFEQNIMSPEWLGKIKLTLQMKDLERRSEFSKDLRVRYANADLNLSMDGWAKTDESAELLIQKAQTDTQYRAAAVYFMGMLAGRGIAYDRLHPVLLDYAQHDPDAPVRQWAVEGMRYLGTDEALGELFDIFTSDPSYQVRDRAGCNISDCGNFKRAQRMRMAPKFLALVADPQTNSQMKSWGFLALHEITGENLPNDASAWQNWYDQHGAEKLAQFEQADWWQVNGDE